MGSKYKAAVCKGVAQGQEISATEEKVDIISFIESRKKQSKPWNFYGGFFEDGYSM